MHPIVIKNVSKTYKIKKKKIEALKNINLEVKEGEIFGLLGPNGAGKTTIINIMLNLLTQDEGEVYLMGEKPGPEILSKINVITGGSEFHYALTPNDILNFFCDVYEIQNRKERIAELVKLLRMDYFMDRKFRALSTGEKLRVAFAKAFLNKPKLLLMDEPTLGLDPDVALQMRKEIKKMNKEGTTILLTSHYMHEIEQLCDRIAFIDKGEIVDIGTVEEVKLKKFGTYDIMLTLDKKPTKAFLDRHGLVSKGNKVKGTFSKEDSLSRLLSSAHEAGYKIKDVRIKKPTLEDYFIKILSKK